MPDRNLSWTLVLAILQWDLEKEDMAELLSVIESHAVFAKLDAGELESLRPLLQRLEFPEGQHVFESGQAPQSLYFIETGSFILHLNNNEYKILRPGDLFGEIGVINGDIRSGTISAGENATVISLDGKLLFQEEYVDPKIAIKILLALSKRITNYLRSKEQISTREIIEQGESDHVEFKSTLRWNLHADKKDKNIENAVLKTLVAFMNSSGGLLLVGVSDEGELLGLETDRFPNKDSLLLHLTNIIKERIGTLFLKFLDYSIEKISGKDVLRIDCLPSSRPAYLLDDKQDHFYIRTGPSTTDLRLSKVYSYIIRRFEMSTEE